MSTKASTSKLFEPIEIGNLQLKHRVVHAPLTRFRADDHHVQTDLVIKYYTQRASQPGTLLISEATLISPEAGGYDHVPGIWSDAQIAQWKKVSKYLCLCR
jgi:NADPH2 dehydrogenase